ILSFRAIGEGHISSIVFRQGIIDKDCNISFEKESFFVRDAEIIRHHMYEKDKFISTLRMKNIPDDIIEASTASLSENFIYQELETAVENFKKNLSPDSNEHKYLLLVLWS